MPQPTPTPMSIPSPKPAVPQNNRIELKQNRRFALIRLLPSQNLMRCPVRTDSQQRKEVSEDVTDTAYLIYSQHARSRLNSRAISQEEIGLVITYGRRLHTRHVMIHSVGKKEIEENGKFLERCAGLHVLCNPHSGKVITAYRNQNFKGLRSW